MSFKHLIIGGALACGLATPALAANVTPDIIFGSGNSNGGFTVNTFGDLELGIRAKRRYPANDAIGNGIVQDSSGSYVFDTTGASSVPAGRSFWSFDWSINSDITDGSDPLSSFSYLIGVDYDPTVKESIVSYDPLGAFGTGYYLGTNASGNGGTGFDSGGDEDFSSFNVAQNSVNMGFLPGAPVGSGQYTVSLSAFSGSSLVGSTSIDVIVDAPAPIPLPAGGLLLTAALGGIAMVGRRRRPAS